MAETGELLAVLGGTFDPPHVGHAIIAQDLIEELELDRLLLVPSADPPHRTAVLPAEERLALVTRLFASAPEIEVSDLELRRSGPSHTVDTLDEIRRARSPRRLYCVIGADQLRVIDTWHDYRRLPELAEIAVMRRGGEEPELPRSADRIAYITVNVTRVDVSASQVRARLRDGRPIRYMVPESDDKEDNHAAIRNPVRAGDEEVASYHRADPRA
jgi:nicotinate-nucleotide adenylyltransferase